LALVLAAFFWGSNMVIGRAIVSRIPPFTLAFSRWTIAAVVVAPFAWRYWGEQRRLVTQHALSIACLGVVGIGGYNTFAYLGLRDTTATNAALLNSFIPVATMAMSWLFFARRLSALELLGVLISFGGVMTIVGRGSLSTFANLNLNAGDLWVLLAVLDWSVYTIALAWRPKGVHPLLMLALMIGSGLLALTPGLIWDQTWGEPTRWTPWIGLAVAYLGVFPSVVAYLFYNRGVAQIGAGKASLFIHLMPVVGTLLATLFLSEVPHGYHYVGIALIFVGIGLTMSRKDIT
jgi:drug/metabolite transporter (DMT)-like permease